MNATKLKTTIEMLLSDEAHLDIQQKLAALSAALSNFASNTGVVGHQLEVSKTLQALRASVDRLTYDPSALKRIDEISASRFFGRDLLTEIEKSLSENQMTPAVVQQMVARILGERTAYLQQLAALLEGLEAIGVEVDELTEGEAEIGFQIPRDLFSNELSGLIKELKAINRIIRAFAELATGSVEPIEVKQISTSDPTFFFGLPIATIALMGVAVRWALDTWKEVEEIRKVRAAALKLGSFTLDEAESIFDTKITKTIKAAIDAKKNELVPTKSESAGRSHEQQIDIAWALESVLARVERGMTVEIRFIPPPAVEGEPATDDVQRLQEVIPQLSFPTPDPNPILALPSNPE